ncbi:hypothetical protein N9C10_02910 [Flavobacteriaceae bacterium]|nr:hypothetical protein [Flavobacteriaceae bacterium]
MQNNNWETNQMVQTFINNENPSLEETIEAYHYRDINMNLSIEDAKDFMMNKLALNDDVKNKIQSKFEENDHKGLYECLTLDDLMCLGW